MRPQPLAVLTSMILCAGLVTPAVAAGPKVSYPLRHSFSMAVGLPGHGKHEPTSCIDVNDEQKNYVCRIVAGYEETGDKRNFFVAGADALDDGHDPHYGHALVARDGITYEGCRPAGSDWHCDYQSRSKVSGRHYDSDGYVLQVMWAWKNHTQAQLGCAAAVTGFLAGPGWWPFGVLVKDCLNGPMERPN